MSVSRGYRLQMKVAKQQRPVGVALFAGIGVLASLLLLFAGVLGLWMLMRISATPSPQLAVVGLVLIAAILVLWVNWGAWEMLRWAWWANVLLSALGIGAAALGLGYVPAAADLAHALRPTMASDTVAAALRAGLLGSLIFQLAALLYMFSAHKAFGVGVKDERPLWEKVHRF